MIIDEQTSPYEALQMALKQEREALELYRRAAEVVQDDAARQMFEFLVKEEEKHERLLLDEIDKHVAPEF
jgi:rubrerythrin